MGLPCTQRGDGMAAILQHSTLIFMGDSLTRYQYLDLVYSLHYGNSDHEQWQDNNPLQERTWQSFSAFYNGTHGDLQPYERVCDCYRGLPGCCDNVTENRLYVHEECDIRVAYLEAFGEKKLLGHWPLHDIWSWTFAPISTAEEWDGEFQSLQADSWETVLTDVVKNMHPTVLIMNAVWKTTTARNSNTTRDIPVDLDIDTHARHVFVNDTIFEAAAHIDISMSTWSNSCKEASVYTKYDTDSQDSENDTDAQERHPFTIGTVNTRSTVICSTVISNVGPFHVA